jgi:hypothetical protein
LKIFSKRYSSGVFLKLLTKDIKFLISKDFVEISKFLREKLLFINEFIAI